MYIYMWILLRMNAHIYFKNEYLVTNSKDAAVTALKTDHFCLFAL